MRSFLAALRSLVLPAGATSGKRLVIDGVTGRISGYDVSNVEVMRMSVDTGFYTTDGTQEAQLIGGGLTFDHVGGTDQTFYQVGEFGMSEDGINFAYFRQLIGSGSNPKWQTSVPIVKDTSWTGLTYSNSWVDFGSPYDNGEYRMMPDGTVKLRGLIKGGTGTDGTTIFTLPAGYRPAKSKIFHMHDGGNARNAAVVIDNAGVAKVFGAAAAPTAGYSLEQVRFEVI